LNIFMVIQILCLAEITVRVSGFDPVRT
jgi:hypothetical protein